MSEERYTVLIHDEGGSGYHLWAEVEELPGLFASGRDHDELLEALTETIGGYLSKPGHEVHIGEATAVSSEDGSRAELSVRLIDSEQDDDAERPRFADPELDELSRRMWSQRFEAGRRVQDDDIVRAAIGLAILLRSAGKKNREAG